MSKQLINSAVRKLIEYNYVQIRRGIVYRFLPGRKLELTQEDIDKHKEVELEKLSKMMEYCNSKSACAVIYWSTLMKPQNLRAAAAAVFAVRLQTVPRKRLSTNC